MGAGDLKSSEYVLVLNRFRMSPGWCMLNERGDFTGDFAGDLVLFVVPRKRPSFGLVLVVTRQWYSCFMLLEGVDHSNVSWIVWNRNLWLITGSTTGTCTWVAFIRLLSIPSLDLTGAQQTANFISASFDNRKIYLTVKINDIERLKMAWVAAYRMGRKHDKLEFYQLEKEIAQAARCKLLQDFSSAFSCDKLRPTICWSWLCS